MSAIFELQRHQGPAPLATPGTVAAELPEGLVAGRANARTPLRGGGQGTSWEFVFGFSMD